MKDSRTDAEVLLLTAALKKVGDKSSKALETVLMGAAAGTREGHDPVSAEMISVEDLRLQAGGRHDNDYTDFRSISIMITSEEVRF